MQFDKNKEKLHKITMKSSMTFPKTFTRRMTFNATLNFVKRKESIKSQIISCFISRLCYNFLEVGFNFSDLCITQFVKVNLW